MALLPVIFYLPETGLGYGALALGTFRFKGESKETRPSSMQLAVTLTSKSQFLVYAPFELYSNEEKWRFVGELGYYKYFYNFFGKGINSKQEDLEIYEVDFPRLRLSVLREVLPDISVGLAYEFDNFSKPILEEGGILDSGDFIGKNGGTISNLGLTAIYDSRDNIFFPTKGVFCSQSIPGSATVNKSQNDHVFLSTKLNNSTNRLNVEISRRSFPRKKVSFQMSHFTYGKKQCESRFFRGIFCVFLNKWQTTAR